MGRRKGRTEGLDIHLGARLRLSRLMKGLSREGLARELRISINRVEEYERGDYPLDAETLSDLARILSVPVVSFYEPIGGQDEGLDPLPTGSPLTPTDVEFLRIYLSLSDEDRGHVLTYVEMVAGLQEPE